MTNRFERYAREDRRESSNSRFARYAQAEPISRTDTFLRGAQDSFTFGWADEFAGLVGGEEERDRVRQRQELARAYHPNTYLAGQVGGALVGGGGLGALGRGALRLAPAAASAASRMGALSRIGVGAGTGALGGAAYGAGDAADGMRGQGALQGAGTGAVFGGLGQAGGELIGRVGGAVGRALSPEARAASMIGGMQQRFGQSGDDLVTALRDAPDDAMLLDVIPGGTQIASGAGARPSAGREAMRSALDARNATGAQNAVDDIWRDLGGSGRRSGAATIDELSAVQRREAAPLYQAALSRPLSGEQVERAERLLQPIVRNNPRLFRLAQRRAADLSRSENNGRVFGRDDPRYWHYLRQGADEAYATLGSPMAGVGGLGPGERAVYARALDGYRTQLGRILGPEYRQANAIWGGAARQQNAIRLGFDAMSGKADDLALGEVRRAVRRMQPGELQAMRIGALAKMTDLLENAATETGRSNPVRALIRSTGQRRVLATLFGGEAQLAQVIRRLEQRQQLFQNSIEMGVGVNSHTADRLHAFGSQQARTNPIQGGIKDSILRLITGDAADQYDEAVSNQLLQALATPARQASREIDAAGGVQQWSQGRGLLSRALREAERRRTQRPRDLVDAFSGGLYAPAIGGGAVGYGGM